MTEEPLVQHQNQAQNNQATKYNNYQWALMISLLVAMGVSLTLLILHLIAFGSPPTWLLEMMRMMWTAFFTSQIVAGAGYLGMLGDRMTNSLTLRDWFRLGKTGIRTQLKGVQLNGEAIGLGIGIALAVGFTIAQAVLHVLPFGHVVRTAFAAVIAFAMNANTLGALGTRAGRAQLALQTKNFSGNGKNYIASLIGGFVIGIAFIAIVCGLGLLTAGVVPALMFCFSAIGAIVSTSGYVGRLFDVLLGKNRTVVGLGKEADNTFKTRANWEMKGTAIGMGVGIAVAVLLMVFGFFTLPFGIGLPHVIAGIFLFATAVSAGAGLGNRLGNVADKKISAAAEKKAVLEVAAYPTASLDPKPDDGAASLDAMPSINSNRSETPIPVPSRVSDGVSVVNDLRTPVKTSSATGTPESVHSYFFQKTSSLSSKCVSLSTRDSDIDELPNMGNIIPPPCEVNDSIALSPAA